jgi:tetratricopeptide (TPR) repeat protein
MAHWGIALASGPFYNLPWGWLSENEAETMLLTCYNAVQQALEHSANTTPVEKALIQALSQRYPSNQVVSTEEFCKWDDAYADAMRAVHANFPEDFDVIALFAEAMMTRTPWKLWDIDRGEPSAGADTIETLAVLDAGFDLILKRGCAPHPGVVHMYIHALEMSPTPEHALKAADQLFDLCPDVGHLQHMPAHIYVICGQYEDAIRVSRKAITADDQYVDFAGRYNFYTTSRCHDLHMMMYASMFAGQFEPAIQAAQTLTATLSADLLAVERPHMAVTLEGYHSTFMHVLVRFGKWQEIIDSPLPDDPVLYCVSSAMCHYARSVAHSALGQIDAATEERDLFREARKQVPESRLFFNNNADDILAIADAMMMGELEYRKENHETAFNHLETAVQLNDNLYYTEPWAWMHPPRHALGALLLEQGHVEKAEQVYRADLGLDKNLARPLQHPNNVWGLHGYLECLQRTGQYGKSKEVQKTLNSALAQTGQKITSSCYCRRTG